MRMMVKAAVAVALLGGTTLPAAAQEMAAPLQTPGGPGVGGGFGHGGGKGMRLALRNLSTAGQQTMREAFQSLRNDGTRDQIKAARDRQLALLEADRLDVTALQRAMAEERNLAQGAHQRMQAALVSAYQRLSVEDRRALVASARQARQWMDDRRREWRERRRDRFQGQPTQS